MKRTGLSLVSNALRIEMLELDGLYFAGKSASVRDAVCFNCSMVH